MSIRPSSSEALPPTDAAGAPLTPGGPDPSAGRVRRLSLSVRLGAGAVVLGALGVLGSSLLSTKAAPRGERSAALAARSYVHAINAGDKSAAAAVACSAFTGESRAEARSGADPGISFVLGPVSPGKDAASARARITERLTFADSVQQVRHTLDLARQDGRWVVCGQH